MRKVAGMESEEVVQFRKHSERKQKQVAAHSNIVVPFVWYLCAQMQNAR